MKRVGMVAVVCCVGFFAYAGDTNFVAAFNAVWKTHNASNILVFVEQNVATNKSPETLFARGTIAVTLQACSQDATNYWEHAIQMVTTNNVYSDKGKTNAVKQIQAVQNLFAGASTNHPSWNTELHNFFFKKMGDEVPYLGILQRISTIERVENETK